jgi:hypothetical protein
MGVFLCVLEREERSEVREVEEDQGLRGAAPTFGIRASRFGAAARGEFVASAADAEAACCDIVRPASVEAAEARHGAAAWHGVVQRAHDGVVAWRYCAAAGEAAARCNGHGAAIVEAREDPRTKAAARSARWLARQHGRS